MSFKALLREIVEGCGGGIGAALMGNDGIPIEQVTASHAVASPLAEDIATPPRIEAGQMSLPRGSGLGIDVPERADG